MFYYTYVSKLKQSHIFVSLLPLLVTFDVTLHFHQNVNEFAFMTSVLLISNLNDHLVASKQVEQDGCKEAWYIYIYIYIYWQILLYFKNTHILWLRKAFLLNSFYIIGFLQVSIKLHFFIIKRNGCDEWFNFPGKNSIPSNTSEIRDSSDIMWPN